MKKEIIQKNKSLFSIIAAMVSAAIVLLIMGIPTAVIETPWYMRMTPVSYMDYFFLVSVALLFGVLIGLFTYRKIERRSASYTYGLGGVLGGSLAISCPLCIAVFVAIFGSTAMLTYFDPLRPIIGIVSIGLLSYGIYNLIYCKSCKVTKHDKR